MYSRKRKQAPAALCRGAKRAVAGKPQEQQDREGEERQPQRGGNDGPLMTPTATMAAPAEAGAGLPCARVQDQPERTGGNGVGKLSKWAFKERRK